MTTIRLSARVSIHIQVVSMLKRRTLDWYTSPTGTLAKVAAVQQLRPLLRQSRADSCAIERAVNCGAPARALKIANIHALVRVVERRIDPETPAPSREPTAPLYHPADFHQFLRERTTSSRYSASICTGRRLSPARSTAVCLVGFGHFGSRNFPRHSADIRAI